MFKLSLAEIELLTSLINEIWDYWNLYQTSLQNSHLKLVHARVLEVAQSEYDLLQLSAQLRVLKLVGVNIFIYVHTYNPIEEFFREFSMSTQ